MPPHNISAVSPLFGRPLLHRVHFCFFFLFLICLVKSRQLLIHIKKLWHFSFPWLLSPAICRPHSEPHTVGLHSSKGCAVWSCPYFPFPWPWKEVALVTRQTSFSMKWEKNLLDVVCLQAWYGFLNVCRYGVVTIAVHQRLEAKPGQRLQDFGMCSLLDSASLCKWHQGQNVHLP